MGSSSVVSLLQNVGIEVEQRVPMKGKANTMLVFSSCFALVGLLDVRLTRFEEGKGCNHGEKRGLA